jgi:branched-chain amino acid transport system substrate-binding protein
MKQAASIKNLELGGLLLGARLTPAQPTSPPSRNFMRFKGESWERFGDIISGDVSG